MMTLLSRCSFLLSLAAVVFTQHSSTDPEGRYMALIPSYIQMGSNYSIYFKLLKPVSYEMVQADVYIREKNKTKTLVSGTLSLNSGSQDGTIVLEIPEKTDTESQYSYYNVFLKLEGTGAFKFINDSIMLYRSGSQPGTRNETIFIQTDKAAYSAEQKVRYRVFVLDSELKPVDPTMDISIKDAKGNKIKEQSNVSGLYGVPGELQLSEEPLLGAWGISVKLQGSGLEETTSFSVEEYVLPKFSVEVQLPSYGTVSNPQLKGKVIAKYTYGKPIQGRVILRITKYRGYVQKFEPSAIQTEFEIDGEADFSIATDTLLKFDPSLKYDTLYVEANVTERETGEVRVAVNSIRFHEKPLRLELFYGSSIFHPGFKFTTYVKVSHPEGHAVTQSGDRMKISVVYFTDKKTAIPTQWQPPHSGSSNLMTFISPFPGGSVLFMPDSYLPIPKDGIVKIDLDIPENVATGSMEISFRDQKVTKTFQRYDSVSKAYLHLKMKSNHVKIGDQAEFTVTSNIGPQQVFYHVIKNGQILQTKSTSIRSAFAQTTFYVTMTTDMHPESKIIAYFYDQEHKELIADGITFTVDKSIDNEVTLQFDRIQVSPGSNITLGAKADPGSQVFIRVVDKSVLLLSDKNDITKDLVKRKMQIYEEDTWVYRNQHMYRKLQGLDARHTFQQASLKLVTDACPRGEQSCPSDCTGGQCYGASQSAAFSDITERMVMYHPPSSVRKDFPETWIWTNETVGASGRVDVEAMVPDTITDWVATAFALNKDTGIGVVETPANLTAFLPFYVSLHLPFSIVSEEVAVIQALVFNYYPYDMYVTVTLKNSSDEFVGLKVNNKGQEEEVKEDMEKCVLVKSDDVVSAYFTIKPHKIGTIELEVEAESSRGKDTVRRHLIVRPPGIQEEENIVQLVTLSPSSDTDGMFEADIPVMYPPRIVPGSQRVQVTVIGDIFGPSLDHLDQLLQIPYGCGEQNMVRFAPAVFAAVYLRQTDRLSGAMETRVKSIMETGYQRQLNYMRDDGSFSAFGHSDKNGSLWLTAFVLKSFAEASRFTYIDPAITEKGILFILDQQKPDGSFSSTGFVHNTAMQGGSASSSKALAAYVLTALLEIKDSNIPTNDTVRARLLRSLQMTWSYLTSSTSYVTDDYEMAITAYAFSLMGRGGDLDLLRKLNASRNIRNTDGQKYWQHPVKSREVEIAGYVLLTYAKQRDQNGGLPILRWLVSQRTPYGGFQSTQDTVVALQAMAEFASLIYSSKVNMSILIDDAVSTNRTLTVDADNMDVLQLVEIAPEARYVRVEASGEGMVLIEVGIFYNILNGDKNPSFDLRVSTNGTELNTFTLKACARWLGQEDSGMVLMEISFPSGFTPIPIHELKASQSGSYQVPDRVEMDRGQLVLYYNKMKGMQCYRADVVREMLVGKPQPAMVKVFAYYDTEKHATKFYLPNTLKKGYICEFCGVECGCGYDPDAVPMERCYGSTQALYRMPGRIIQPLETFQTLRQRLQPNQWRRGQTIPVSFNSGRTVSLGKPRMQTKIYPDGTIWRTIS